MPVMQVIFVEHNTKLTTFPQQFSNALQFSFLIHSLPSFIPKPFI